LTRNANAGRAAKWTPAVLVLLTAAALGLQAQAEPSPDRNAGRARRSDATRLARVSEVQAAETASAPAVLRCDLAVIGGGSGGFGAALAAARQGLDVVLVERAECLGGNSVRGGIHCWEMGAGGTGIPFDLYQRLRQLPGAVGIYSIGRHGLWFKPDQEPYRFPGGESVLDPKRSYADTLRRHGTRGMHADEAACREQWHGVVFEPEAMAATMKALLDETGRCRVLLNTALQTVQATAGRVESLQLDDGRRIVARSYVDATGDGWLCLGAGCEAMTGQEARDRFDEPSAPAQASQQVNGVTLIYRVAPVTEPAIEPLPQGISNRCWWAKNFPVAVFNRYPNGDLNINMLPTMDGSEFMRLGYRDAMEECRKRTLAHWHDLQTRFEEFSRFKLVWTAPSLGVRETRRIVGDYVLTERDVRGGLSRQTHPDLIALADHALDTHGSHAHGIGELSEPYGVPYRCLIPKGWRNLLIACRAASFSSLAASSCRLSRTMMQLGQAAGTAAALAKELNVDLPDVPPDRLRTALREQHVQLEHPMPESLLKRVNAETAVPATPRK
jgi:hypothetical protein